MNSLTSARPSHVISLLAAATALALAGCGGQGQARKAVAYHGDSQPAADYSSAGESAGAYDAPQSDVDERPGLGTSFGETRVSRVRHSPFVRDAADPFAEVALFYNDVEGVRAALDYHRAQLGRVRASADGGGISVWLTDASGTTLPGADAGGRVYVVGHDGERYNIEVRNDTGHRLEVVGSVDGLDVIDGLDASPDKRGYILRPHSSLVIDGFRTSSSTVAAFRFGTVRDSYAARTGSDRNVGVIGLAFFAERGRVWSDGEIHRRDSADPFPGRFARPPR